MAAAYQALHGTARQTVRATLAFSPSWSGCGADAAPRMLRDWGRWLAGRGFGDDWLRVQGFFAEKGGDPRHEPRAAALPQTGWAGFCYDAALPRDALREVLLEAARNRIRVSTIRSEIVDLYHEVHRHVPIDGQRWVWVHIGELSRDRIRLAKELGLVLTTHTNRHIWNEGGRHLDRLGAEGAERIVPLRDLLDDGVSVAFGTTAAPPAQTLVDASVTLRCDPDAASKEHLVVSWGIQQLNHPARVKYGWSQCMKDGTVKASIHEAVRYRVTAVGMQARPSSSLGMGLAVADSQASLRRDLTAERDLSRQARHILEFKKDKRIVGPVEL